MTGALRRFFEVAASRSTAGAAGLCPSRCAKTRSAWARQPRVGDARTLPGGIADPGAALRRAPGPSRPTSRTQGSGGAAFIVTSTTTRRELLGVAAGWCTTALRETRDHQHPGQEPALPDGRGCWRRNPSCRWRGNLAVGVALLSTAWTCTSACSRPRRAARPAAFAAAPTTPSPRCQDREGHPWLNRALWSVTPSTWPPRCGPVRCAPPTVELHLHRIDEQPEAQRPGPHRRRRRAAQPRRSTRGQAGDDPGPSPGAEGVKERPLSAACRHRASKIYEGRTARGRLRGGWRACGGGAVIVGLTTAPEFGAVSFTNTPLHGVTRNPWDPSRTPGGSSGGSAAAVASGMLPACTGSDGGGSIRIPASYSGLLGMKATFGRIGAGPGSPFDSSSRRCTARWSFGAGRRRLPGVTAGPNATDPLSLAARASPYEQVVASGAGAGALRRKRWAWSSSLGTPASTPTWSRVSGMPRLVWSSRRAGSWPSDVRLRGPDRRGGCSAR